MQSHRSCDQRYGQGCEDCGTHLHHSGLYGVQRKECGQVFYGSYKGMLGHNYQEETLSNGDIKYTCTTCKRSFTLSASAGKHDHIVPVQTW